MFNTISGEGELAIFLGQNSGHAAPTGVESPYQPGFTAKSKPLGSSLFQQSAWKTGAGHQPALAGNQERNV